MRSRQAFFHMWLFPINVQQTVKSKNKNKQTKTQEVDQTWGNIKTKDAATRRRLPRAVTPGVTRDSIIQINAGLDAQNENKSVESRRQMRRGGSWTRRQLCGSRNCAAPWSSALRCDTEGEPGSGQGRGCSHLCGRKRAWEQAQSPGVFSIKTQLVGINYRDSMKLLLTFRLHIFKVSNAVVLLLINYHLGINKPTQGRLRLTRQL